MKDNVLFLNMFALYEPVEEIRSLLQEAVILGAELDPVQRTIDLELACPGPISNARLAVICREVEQVYGLKALRLKLSFPAGTLYQMDPADLTALFTEENPMCMGSLAGAAWEWEGLSLTVKLRANGKVYSGRGISTDIVGASIHAYINALNKIVYEEDNV